jgi:hypothetical protein
MIRFGISALPPEGGGDAPWLDGLVARGHGAVELPFVRGFRRLCAHRRVASH